jgi:predicted nucleic acid-binding protein
VIDSSAIGSTSAVRFVDTNVLLHAVSTASEERRKAEVARGLLNDDDLALSVQVLQEFYVQGTRETKSERLTHDEAVKLIESWLRFPVKETDVPLMLAALSTRDRYRLSYWDAAIVEAARALGAVRCCRRI